ncbi:MAG: ABC transporter substrate-binding protein, partial [Alkalispirochaeta sp.]
MVESRVRTITVALLVCAAMVAGASGTGEDADSGDDQIDLRVYTQYTDESETVPMDYAVEQMAAVMPEVDLEIEVRARDDNQKIKTYAAAGALPDLFDANADIIETFRRSNNILPLNEYVEELGVEEKLSPAMRDLLYHDDGNIYAIPTVGPWVALIYYNKAVFDRYDVPVPTNYDEFLSAVETFAANDVIPVSLFAKEKWPGVQLFDMVATRFDPRGIVALDADQALMSDAPYRNAVARFVELIDAGIVVPGAFSTGYDQAYAQFVEGRAAMLVNGA